MLFRHDPNGYTTIPTRTPALTLSLSRAILEAAPDKPPKPVSKRLFNIHGKATKLQTTWNDANRPASGEIVRPIDLRVDRAFSAVRSRVQNWVDVEDEERGERAQELLELLFPTGLDFLNLPYPQQWAECERRIVLIDQDGLEADIVDLVDTRFLKRMREAQIAYGEALQITKKKDAVEPTERVIDAMRELKAEIAGYARLVLGLTDEDNPKSVAAAEAQLEPILRYRKRTSGAGEDAELPVAEPIDAPLPEPPAQDE